MVRKSSLVVYAVYISHGQWETYSHLCLYDFYFFTFWLLSLVEVPVSLVQGLYYKKLGNPFRVYLGYKYIGNFACFFFPACRCWTCTVSGKVADICCLRQTFSLQELSLGVVSEVVMFQSKQNGSKWVKTIYTAQKALPMYHQIHQEDSWFSVFSSVLWKHLSCFELEDC